jgi:hypothetical protein
MRRSWSLSERSGLVFMLDGLLSMGVEAYVRGYVAPHCLGTSMIWI